MDTQDFPPCQTTPSRLSFWEEAKVKRKIDVLISLWKIKPNTSEYAYRINNTLRIPLQQMHKEHCHGLKIGTSNTNYIQMDKELHIAYTNENY